MRLFTSSSMYRVVWLVLLTPTFAFPQSAFWQQTGGPAGAGVSSVWAHSGALRAATNLGLYTSLTSGQTWFKNFPPSDVAPYTRGSYIFLVSSDYTVVVGSQMANPANGQWWFEIFFSWDNGQTWTSRYSLGSQNIQSFTMDTSGYVYATYFAQGSGVLRSADHGNTWKQVAGLFLNYTTAIAAAPGGTVVVAVDVFYRSTDHGASWQQMSGLPFSPSTLTCLLADPQGVFFAGSSDGNIFRSTNDGITWQRTVTGLSGRYVYSLAVDPGGNVYCSTMSGLFKTTDKGLNWVQVNTLSDIIGVSPSYVSINLTVDERGKIFVASGPALYSSSDNGSTFQEISAPATADVRSLCFTSAGDLLAGTANGTVLSSRDGGDHWNTRFYGRGWGPIRSIVSDLSGGAYCICDYFNVTSSDGGKSWNANNSYLYDISDPPRCIALDPSGNVFISTDQMGVRCVKGTYYPKNQGLSNKAVRSLLCTASTIFAATDGGGVYQSNDHGDNWTQTSVGITSPWLTSLVQDAKGNIFAGAAYGGGIFRSTDNGSTWRGIGPKNVTVLSLLCHPSGQLFIGSDTGGVFRSTDGGATWAQLNSGLTSSSIQALVAGSGGSVFAGTPSGLFRGVQPATAVTRETIPSGMLLSQNFPNPFNPSTTIQFSLPKAAYTSLKIFNLLGEEVTSLVSGDLEAGQHSIRWEAAGVTSGVYFYRLQAGQFTEIRKLVLLR